MQMASEKSRSTQPNQSAKRVKHYDFTRNLPSSLQPSFWMKHTSLVSQASTALHGCFEADIAIIGGGFVGLWTALTIKELAPNTRIVILEKDVCGGGASGRNGGFVMSWWPKISSLMKFCDKEQALFLARESGKAITDIGIFCQKNRIDAHFQQSGWLWTATTSSQFNAWQSTITACAKLGATPFQKLDAHEIASRTGSTQHLSGVFEATNATVQPAALVEGMRRVALEQGIAIFENTPVLTFNTDQPICIRTPDGEVLANKLVLATNAWSTAIPELATLIVPVNSAIVVTEPIPEKLKAIGWTGNEAITDSQLLVDYYRTTRDGRIAFGKGTGALSYQSVIQPVFSQDTRSCQMAESDFRRTYPMLGNVRLTDSWTGPIDRTYDSLPIFGTLKGTDHVFYGIGWSGNGVGPSRLGGKILASLALGISNEWSQCALVNRQCKHFPPEPFRYLGGKMVRQAVIRKERAEAENLKPRFVDRMLAKLAPAGLEDKS